MPVCLLLLAQTWSCITSQSPAHIFTAAPGQGCWLGQREVKHSSKISGYSFVPWEFVEPQVSRTPPVLRASHSRMLPPRESEMRVLRLSPACEHFGTSPLAQVSAADSSPSAGPAHAHTDPWPPPSSREEKPEGTGREEGPHPPGLPWGWCTCEESLPLNTTGLISASFPLLRASASPVLMGALSSH